MPIRVAHVGTGTVGRLALRHVIDDPRFELTGVCVSTEEKVGRDAGELAGLDADTGIKAAGELDAVLATRPEVVVYCAMGDNRLREAMEDCRRILESGTNVVGTAPTSLIYPWQVLPDKWVDPIEDAARSAGVSIFVNGVDPGFANDLMPLTLAGTCRTIEQVRCVEIADYASYAGATVMFDVMGFGLQEEKTPLLLIPGVLSSAWGVTIRQLATGLGIEIDEIVESYEREPAPEAFDVAAGHIPKGGMAALRFQVSGMSAGRPVLVVEHVTRLRAELRPDWAQPAQPGGSYRIEITGEPSYTVDICPASREGDHNHAAILAGAGRIVNAIPAVMAAEPGIRTTLDLPLVAGNGFGTVSQE
ncbi:NAD(P)H-dependent amine dehydrogenase family protein [Haloechinothrix halophila]|uniref:NAD(P)H-dependent amine dehydrogenase family protein n=1 Tax=Haloechinothrix halophila TaxID=1069073 RepID=UPI0004222344|nr:diacylglycerol kinase [Haloechinothrix halophila]